MIGKEERASFFSHQIAVPFPTSSSSSLSVRCKPPGSKFQSHSYFYLWNVFPESHPLAYVVYRSGEISVKSTKNLHTHYSLNIIIILNIIIRLTTNSDHIDNKWHWLFVKQNYQKIFITVILMKLVNNWPCCQPLTINVTSKYCNVSNSG